MIGVCIKYFHRNYGGMLQAYATIKMLESRGIEYELVQYKKKYTPVKVIRALPRFLNSVLLNDKYEEFLKKCARLFHPEFAKNDNTRMASFKNFEQEHFVKLSPIFIGYGALCDGAKRYSAVITGSDQLWSPAGLPTNYYNLLFVPEEIVKISYASSFGVKDIPWYQKKRTKQYLKRINHISMRENRGSEIVRELSGRNVPTILDPVFMFDAEGWERLIPLKKEVAPPYIFAYFLGRNSDCREVVKKAAKALNCKIVSLRHLDQYVKCDEDFGDFSPYDVDPARFLNILRGADYVCTDSFHGAALSIIHHKQFVVFNRYNENSKNSKNSRIDTLCGNLGINDRRYTSDQKLSEQLNVPIDYTMVSHHYQIAKKETEQYISDVFKEIRRD